METLPYIAGAGLTVALLWLAWTDWTTLRLPNAVTLPLIAAGILFNGLWRGAWVESLLGAAVGYAVFVGVELAYRRLRGRNGLGRGDAKLLAAGGAWCGWEGLPFIVMAASLSALVVVLLFRQRVLREGGRIAFGPFLAMGVGAVWWAQLLVAG